MPHKLASLAIQEDLGRGDLFSRVIDATPMKASIVSKSEGVLSGTHYAQAVGDILNFHIHWFKKEGDTFKQGEILAELSGNSSALLQGERTLLNFLQHASGIATLTATYVQTLHSTSVKLLDTRKTRAGLRILEKDAVRAGGGFNHRLGLDEALMLKDTHLATLHDVPSFLAQARRQIPFTATIEIECDTLEKVKEMIHYDCDIIMCDNLSVNDVAHAVEYKRHHAPLKKLEASGNITLTTLYDYAKTGVDAISTGAIIHQATWLDMSMKAH